MAVRVRVKIELEGKSVETIALVNSGFEADTPQILVPIKMLLRSGIELSRLPGENVEYGTAGGLITMYVARRVCRVYVVEPDRTVGGVEADLVLSPMEREVLISDALGEELRIVLLNLKKGYWRFSDDPPSKVRRSYPPQYW